MILPDQKDVGTEEEFSHAGNTIDNNYLDNDVLDLPSSMLTPLDDPVYTGGGFLDLLDFQDGLGNSGIIPDAETQIPSNEVTETHPPATFQERPNQYPHQTSAADKAAEDVGQRIDPLTNMGMNVPPGSTLGYGTTIVADQFAGPQSSSALENPSRTRFAKTEQAAQFESLPGFQSGPDAIPHPGEESPRVEGYQKHVISPNLAPNPSQSPRAKRDRQTDPSSSPPSRLSTSRARKSRPERSLASKQRTRARPSAAAVTVSAGAGESTLSTPHIPQQNGGHLGYTGHDIATVPTNSNVAMNQQNVVSPGIAMNGHATMDPNTGMVSQGPLAEYLRQAAASYRAATNRAAQFPGTAYPGGGEQHYVFGGDDSAYEAYYDDGAVSTVAHAQQSSSPVYVDTLGDMYNALSGPCPSCTSRRQFVYEESYSHDDSASSHAAQNFGPVDDPEQVEMPHEQAQVEANRGGIPSQWSNGAPATMHENDSSTPEFDVQGARGAGLPRGARHAPREGGRF